MFALRLAGGRWPISGGRRLPLLARPAEHAFDAIDRRFDQYVVRAADQQEMFDIVPPHDDELAFPIEIEHIDDVQPPRPVARSGRADAATEQQPDNIQDEHCGDEERHERSKYWEQLRESIWHERPSLVVRRGNLAKLTAFMASAEKRLING